MVHRLLRRTFNTEIEKSYVEIKASFVSKGCKIVSEDEPKHLLVKQGSLWGMLPETAKKTVDVTFVPVNSHTQVTASSHISSDWKNITIIGCALSAVLASLCVWISLDLTVFLKSGKVSFWSWLASVNGNVDVSVAQTFINLTKSLAIFLSVVIVLEIVVAAYAYRKIDKFAKETLDAASKNETTSDSHT
jgi:hypothetical protein